jgi:tripartite-type tricarboxylate transporter receptor subunit TctC
MKKFLGALSLSVIALLHAGSAAAQAFPAKPVTIVVPYLAGGSIDVFSRAVGTKLSTEWGQPVVILNKAGANEAIAADFVAKSAPDGYTLLIATESALTLNPHLVKRLSYNPLTDLVPVSRLVNVPMVLFAPANSPAKTLPEFISLARSNKKSLNYGSTGTGGIVHIPLAVFAKQENLDMVHVPYKGAAALVPDTISGLIDLSVIAVSNVEPYVKAGKLKALAISAPTRSDVLPDTPTFKEAGVKDIDAFYNIGLLAAKGTPATLVDKLAADVQRVVQNTEFRKVNIDPYAYLTVGSSPAQYKDFIEKDFKAQGEKIKSLNVSLE